MSLRQPWFLVMAPKAAARRNDFWVGYGTKLPRGEVMARLVAPENRTLLAAFGVAWVVAALADLDMGLRLGRVFAGVFSAGDGAGGRRHGRELRPPDMRPDDRAATEAEANQSR